MTRMTEIMMRVLRTFVILEGAYRLTRFAKAPARRVESHRDPIVARRLLQDDKTCFLLDNIVFFIYNSTKLLAFGWARAPVRASFFVPKFPLRLFPINYFFFNHF